MSKRNVQHQFAYRFEYQCKYHFEYQFCFKKPTDLIDKIDCVGDFSGNGRITNRICAASGPSYFQKDSWTIFLTSSALKVKNIF